MNPLLWKGALGLIGSAVVAGIAGIAVKYSKEDPKPIQSLLEKGRPDKRLLFAARGASDADWKAAWAKYVDKYKDSKTNNPFGINAVLGDGNAPSEFMQKCESLFKEKVGGVESENYKLTLDYCTRDTLVSDFVWEKGKQVVTGDSDTEWSSLWSEYKKAGDKWNLNKPNEQNAPEEFKTQCKEKSKTKTGNPKEEIISEVFLYCSKSQPAKAS